jgi:4'-phosphopantetheinyl transferase
VPLRIVFAGILDPQPALPVPTLPAAVWWAIPRMPEAEALALLTDLDRGRLTRLRRPADQARFATGRVLARTVLGARLGLAPGAVPLATEPASGRPAGTGPLMVHGHPLSVSVAHADDRVLVAVSDAGRVGVDVEPLDGPVADPLLWRESCAPAELAALERLPRAARPAAFARLWTQKEAVLKALGVGLARPPATVLADEPGARLAAVDVGPGYAASVALLTR